MNYPTGAEAAEAFTVEAQQLCKAEANDYLNTCCVTPCTSQGVWNGAKGKTKTKLQLHLSNRQASADMTTIRGVCICGLQNQDY